MLIEKKNGFYVKQVSNSAQILKQIFLSYYSFFFSIFLSKSYN